MHIEGSVLGVNWPEREAVHAPQYSSKLSNS
jgi:hypothetical protein